MRYASWLAWRFLRGQVRQTALTVTGVVLGVTIVTIMQSYIGGFLNYFTTRALDSTPSITVTQQQRGLPNPASPAERGLSALGNPVVAVAQLPIPEEEETLEDPARAEAAIAALPGVIAVSPFVTGQGILVNGDLREAVSFVGISPRQEVRVTDFRQRLVAGSPDALAESAGGIILGAILADDVSAEVGDRVTIISQTGVSRRFAVVGIYAVGLETVDATRAFLNLRQAQQLLGERGISGIGVRVASRDLDTAVARQIEAVTPYRAQTWRELNSGILDLFSTISAIIFLVVGFTMLVAGFGIANTLIMTVNAKRREIGVLKAMGVPPRQIALLFISMGAFVGALGVAIGLLLGALGIDLLARTEVPLVRETGELLQAETFPMLRTPRVFLLSGAFGLLVSIVASVLPSLRAAKQDPLVVIREAE